MTILVPIADGPLREQVLDVATEMSRRYDRPLYVVHLVGDAAADGDARAVRSAVDDYLSSADAEYDVAIEHLSHGGARSGTRVAREILDLAADVGVDHIVMGHTEKGFVEGVTQGSAASAVVDDATVPVTIVPESMA
jgi:nucleotide-binding universal stress UspA family protein